MSRFALAVMLVAIAVIVATTGNTSVADTPRIELTGEEEEFLRQLGEISMCVDPDWMPYEEVDEEGNFTGIAADLVDLVSERLGIPFVIYPTADWDETLECSRAGECLLIPFLNQTEEREEWLAFTEPLFVDPNVFVTREEHPYISDPGDLVDKTIALPYGTSIEEWVRRDYPNLTVITTEDEVEAFRLVENREADMTLRSLMIAHYIIREEGLLNLKVSGEIPEYTNHLRMGVLKEETQLVEILDKAITSITPQERDEIVNRHVYIRQEATIDEELVFGIAGVLVLLIFGLFSFSLYRQRFQLVREVDRRTQELAESEERYRDMALKADAANEAKSRFLANVSHEVRTPLNAIVGFTGLAMKTGLSTRQRDYLHKIQTASGTLLGAVNDILDFSKIEAGKFHIEDNDMYLPAICGNVATLLAGKAHEKGLDFNLYVDRNIPQPLRGDALRLEQVLINLVANAVKFTHRGEVTLSAVLLARGEDGKVQVRFSVKDTGIGISPRQKQGLFQPFVQADDSVTRDYGGTGLGLAICKSLVEMMGGRIGFDSEPGRGSEFYFHLPFWSGAEEQAGNLLPVPESMQGLHVLLADDNETSRELMRKMLEVLGFRVTMAASGAAALESLRDNPPDDAPKLVLMDEMMPDLDGLETIRRLRKEFTPEELPVIILTTSGSRGTRWSEREPLGIAAALGKPAAEEQLYNVIMEVLEGKTRSPDAAQLSEGAAGSEATALAGSRVLLTDDSQLNRELAAELLEAVGVEVDVAHNGAEAVDRVAGACGPDGLCRYDAVLMDVQMPVMDGLEATRTLRREYQLPGLPIIAMTAHAMIGDRESCLAAGMNDYVPKPVIASQLYLVLSRWIPARPAVNKPAVEVAEDDNPAKLPTSVPSGLVQWEEAVAGLGGNVGLFVKLCGFFVLEHETTMSQVRQALDQGERYTAQRLAHNLKGAAGSIGAYRLQGKALLLEEALGAGESFPELEPLLDEAQDLLQSTIGALRSYALAAATENQPEVEAIPEGGGGTEVVSALMEELDRALESGSFAALDLFDQLQGILATSETEGILPVLDRLIRSFSLAEAQQELRRLREIIESPEDN